MPPGCPGHRAYCSFLLKWRQDLQKSAVPATDTYGNPRRPWPKLGSPLLSNCLNFSCSLPPISRHLPLSEHFCPSFISSFMSCSLQPLIDKTFLVCLKQNLPRQWVYRESLQTEAEASPQAATYRCPPDSVV